MNPELKAYLDDYHARTMARYDAVDRQFALMLKILTGVSTPQPGCPMATAADDGLTDQSSVPAVVPDTSSSNEAQETMELTPSASPASIEMVPVTCSTECSTQVITVTHIDEIHDNTKTVRPEPAVNINDKEVEQLTPAWAPPTISTSTSLNKEVVPPVTTTININPKAGVQELDTSPLFGFDTSTPGTSELYHDVILVASNNLATPVPTRCSTESPVPAGDWVKPLTATIDSADETHDAALAERLHPPSFEHQPWPPPVQVQFNHIGHLFRPSPWPSFDCCPERTPMQYTWPQPIKTSEISHMGHLFRSRWWACFTYHLDAGYPGEPYSAMHTQPHEVSWFSSRLLLFLVISLRVRCWQYEQLQQLYRPDRASPRKCMAGQSFPRGETLLVIFHPSMYMEQFRSLGLQDFSGCIKSSLGYWVWESTPSVSIMVDAWSNSRYHGTNCRTHTTATLAGCGMATSRAISCNGTFAIQANCLISEDFINSEHTDPESQSGCSRKVGDFLNDVVQLPIDSSHMVNSARSIPSYWNDLVITNVDDTLKSIVEDNCSKGKLVKDSTLDLSCEVRPEQQENIYSRKSATKVSTNYTVSSGYLLMAPNVSRDSNFLGESWRSLPSVEPHEIHISELVLLSFGGDAFLQLYCCELSPVDGTFSCLPDAQRQSWCPTDRAMSDAKQYNQAGYSQTAVHETICTETNPTPAGYLTHFGPEAIHREPMNYQDMQLCLCYIVHLWEAYKSCSYSSEQQEEICNRESATRNLLNYQVQAHAAICSFPQPDPQTRMKTNCKKCYIIFHCRFFWSLQRSSKPGSSGHLAAYLNSDSTSVTLNDSHVHLYVQFRKLPATGIEQEIFDQRCTSIYICDQPPVAFISSARAAPYVVWSTRYMQLFIEGSHERLNLPTELRSYYMRTNSAFRQLTGVLWKLTQSWTFTDHCSTLSSYWWCFSWGPDAGLTTTMFWLAHNNTEKLQEGMTCISESCTTCGGLHAMRSITEDYPIAFLVMWQFIQSVQHAPSCE